MTFWTVLMLDVVVDLLMIGLFVTIYKPRARRGSRDE
jgi:hypothetical protein